MENNDKKRSRDEDVPLVPVKHRILRGKTRSVEPVAILSTAEQCIVKILPYMGKNCMLFCKKYVNIFNKQNFDAMLWSYRALFNVAQKTKELMYPCAVRFDNNNNHIELTSFSNLSQDEKQILDCPYNDLEENIKKQESKAYEAMSKYFEYNIFKYKIFQDIGDMANFYEKTGPNVSSWPSEKYIKFFSAAFVIALANVKNIILLVEEADKISDKQISIWNKLCERKSETVIITIDIDSMNT